MAGCIPGSGDLQLSSGGPVSSRLVFAEEEGQEFVQDTVPAVFQISFDLRGCGTPIGPVYVNAGSGIEKPSDPQAEGFIPESLAKALFSDLFLYVSRDGVCLDRGMQFLCDLTVGADMPVTDKCAIACLFHVFCLLCRNDTGI